MTKKLLFANRKGGVGKTPAAYYTALHYAKAGRSVSVIDLDGQCNLSDMIAPGYITPGIADVLEGRCGLADALTPVKLFPQLIPLRIARATGDLYDLESSLSTGLGVMKLYNAMRVCEDLGDVVIIDTPPHIGALTISAIVTVGMLRGWVVVPTRPDGDSVSGVESIRREISNAAESLSFPPCLLGTIITMTRDTITHQRWIGTLMSEKFPPVLGTTPLRGGEAADAELRQLYAPVADVIWQMMGGDDE